MASMPACRTSFRCPFSPLIGTLGAVIAMEPRMGHRRALFDIGITGPLAGLVPTFIFLIVGLHHSTFVRCLTALHRCLASRCCSTSSRSCILGARARRARWSLLDPMAFAGWVGLLITSLNLIPIGQLDGGHVLYALLRQKAQPSRHAAAVDGRLPGGLELGGARAAGR